MIITTEVLDQIKRKNKRARKRMARRYMRKVDERIGQLGRYNLNEMELCQLGKLRGRQLTREELSTLRGADGELINE